MYRTSGLKASAEDGRGEEDRGGREQQRNVLPKPQQEHDGNYTNTFIQPVHPAKRNILSAQKITGYTVVIFWLHKA